MSDEQQRDPVLAQLVPIYPHPLGEPEQDQVRSVRFFRWSMTLGNFCYAVGERRYARIESYRVPGGYADCHGWVVYERGTHRRIGTAASNAGVAILIEEGDDARTPL